MSYGDDPRADWAWWSLTPLGLGAWMLCYVGAKARNTRWVLLGALWSAITLAGWALVLARGGATTVGGILITVGWAGAVVASFSARASVRTAHRQLEAGSGFDIALAAAEKRLRERDRARKLGLEHPRVAREMGVGRPDLPNALHAGLIDVNNAPPAVLRELPGVDDALAAKIVETRAEVGLFSSVEEFGSLLGLDGELVEDLRDHVIFLPR